MINIPVNSQSCNFDRADQTFTRAGIFALCIPSSLLQQIRALIFLTSESRHQKGQKDGANYITKVQP